MARGIATLTRSVATLARTVAPSIATLAAIQSASPAGARLKIAVLAGALASHGALAQTPGPGALPGRAVSQHGAWSVLCGTQPGASGDQCGAVQRVVSTDRPDLGLTVIVFETADGGARVMRVLAPLDIFLPKGLGLSIDGREEGRAVFVRCLREGCQAEVVLEDALVGRLKRGGEATFVVFQSPEEGTGFPVDLTGFTAAFDEVTGR